MVNQCAAHTSGSIHGKIIHTINSNFTTSLPDTSGKYCYCQLESYTSSADSTVSVPTPWALNDIFSDSGDCATNCTYICSRRLQSGDANRLAFRAAIFDTILPIPDLTTEIGTTDAGTDYAYISNSGTGNNSSQSTLDFYGLTENGDWAVNYGADKGYITGVSQCTTRAGDSNTWANNTYNIISSNFTDTLPDSSGKYCYCKLTGYAPDDGSPMSLYGTQWVYRDSRGSADLCAGGNSCAYYCAKQLWESEAKRLAFRGAVLGTVTPTSTSCDVNTYNVSYNCNGGNGPAPSNGTATYNSAFTAASNTCTKSGYTFDGWLVGSGSGSEWINGTTWTYTEDKTFYAKWTVKTYVCNPGQYLPAGNTWTASEISANDGRRQCLANSYCTGSGQTPFTYSESADQGIASCPSGYPSSDAGSDAQTDCYRTCTTAEVVHSANVTGNFYFGETAQSNSCEPTPENGCVPGYNYDTAGLNLVTEIGASSGTAYAYIGNNGAAVYNQSTYGLTNQGTWAVDYGTGKGVIKGQAKCTTQGGIGLYSSPAAATAADVTTAATLPDTSGGNCWCQITSYRPDGGAIQSLSASWVFYYDEGGSYNCAYGCARDCASNIYSSNFLTFRFAVLGAVDSGPAICKANTITINWNGTTQAAIDANNAGVATYDGDIRTPASASHIPGKTFTGWRFSTTAPSNGN